MAGVTYIGHATLLVELGGTRVLTDPLLRTRIGHLRRRVPLPGVEALRPLDAIVISHAHMDHLDPRSLRLLGPDCQVIAPRACTGLLRHSGVRQAIEAKAGDRIDLGGIAVEAVPAAHDGRRVPLGPRRAALGYVLRGPQSLYFAGDTDLYPEMAGLSGIDVAALPVAGWGPRLPAGHLDPESAARAVALIGARIAIPIHWGTMVGLGAGRRGDPARPATQFAAAVARLAPYAEARVLAPGERLEL